MPFSLLFLFIAPYAEASRVRTVDVQKDQIVTVKTAIGIATIIQVPDRPTSLVVGDSEAFKIEYLDQAITIKPLSSNAKSNLYIYTDWRRFSVQLVTSTEALAAKFFSTDGELRVDGITGEIRSDTKDLILRLKAEVCYRE